jgi:nucleoside phosphorylase
MSGQIITNDIDACVICALPEEADAFMRTLALHDNVVFEKAFSKRSKREYRYASIQNNSGEPLKLLVSWPPGYGAVETSLHLKPMLEECKPRFVAMTGICAGDRQKVKLGDIIVADRTFTYDNGKFVRDEHRQVYLYDTDTRHADPTVLQFVRMFDAWKSSVVTLPRPCSRRQQREWLLCQLLKGTTLRVDDISPELLNKNAPAWRKIVHDLQRKPHCYLTKDRMLRDKAIIEELFYSEEIFPFQDPTQPECYIAPMASGSAIRGDDPFDTIRIPVRGTAGIDMEGATFYRTMVDFPGIHSLLVKGVSDYADREKDDEYHNYAAEIAALYVFAFIKEYVTSDLMPKRGKTREKAISNHRK